MINKLFNCNTEKERKAKIIIDYFTSKTRIDVTDKNYEIAIKLDKMIGIYNSDADALCKYTQMKDLFSSAGAFEREYAFLKQFTDAETICELYYFVQEITEYLKKYEAGLTKEREKELIALEKDDCFLVYPYAKYFVNEYINYDKSPYLKDFLLDKDLYQVDFDRFVMVLYRFDDVLFDQYLRKAGDNRLARQLDVIRKIENLRSGTTTGHTTDGSKFDEIEFYCNLPFYDIDSSNVVCDDFKVRKAQTVDKRIRDLCDVICFTNTNDIMKYMYDHKIIYRNPSLIKEEDIMKTNYSVNGKELTQEGKVAIVKYMKARNIPFIAPAFSAIKNRYLENPDAIKINKEAAVKELKVKESKQAKKEDNE